MAKQRVITYATYKEYAKKYKIPLSTKVNGKYVKKINGST